MAQNYKSSVKGRQ